MYHYCILILFLYSVHGAEEVLRENDKIFIEEEFLDESWETSWIHSEHKGRNFGKFIRNKGKYRDDDKRHYGIQTSQDASFYALSSNFTAVTNKDEPFIIQYTVQHQQNIQCGGGYIKLFDCSLDQKDMHGDSPYLLMFGPDICGPGTRKVHVILNYKGKNHPLKKDISCKDDDLSHMYTLAIRPNNSYEVLIDNEQVAAGDLEKDLDFLPPPMIDDPSASKPDDWDDNPLIPDPNDKKPVDWDQPEHIDDPDAKKPNDWNDEMDGEWEPPKINNPQFKGEWKQKNIDNPAYRGKWSPPRIENPDYKPNPNLYVKDEICAIGFDLWQVYSGTIFDNILLTSDETYALQKRLAWEDIMKHEKENKEKSLNEENSKKEKELQDNIDDQDINNVNIEDDDEHEETGASEIEEHDEL